MDVSTALSAGMIASGVCAFVPLMLGIEAPYGRYANAKLWGLHINGKVAWATQELPALLIPLYLLWQGGAWRTYGQAPAGPRSVLTAAFLAHYAWRALAFPLLIRGGKPSSVVAWALALMFCLANGYLQGTLLVHGMSPGGGWAPHQAAGLFLWLFGWLCNLHADHVLRTLRKPGETGYKVPHGGLFELVSAANFSGEICEWGGYALATWSLPGLAFALMTFCNLAPRGWQHHKWYRRHFTDYPPQRCAVLPFLW